MFYELQTRKALASNVNAIFRKSVIDVFVSYTTRERELKLTNRFVRVRRASGLSARHHGGSKRVLRRKYRHTPSRVRE